MNKKPIEYELNILVDKVYTISDEAGKTVEKLIQLGKQNPLSAAEAESLLVTIFNALKGSKAVSKDPEALKSLQVDIERLATSLVANRPVSEGNPGLQRDGSKPKVTLQTWNGIEPDVVRPNPVFHGRSVPMNSGYVNTREIALWEDNDRLEIHINQFRFENGRSPSPDELLKIMLSDMKLEGIPDSTADQFKIKGLANSIAINGVRNAPIIDLDGTLLDGNRRVAACYYVLNNDDYTPEQKQLASKLFVWQLTEHATDDDRRAVVVSLNFEPDHKQQWPEYVKAKKLYEDWQNVLSTEGSNPGPRRLAELKRELSLQYALGPETGQVNRYIKMVEWANEFSEYHRDKKDKNEFEVEHHTEHYFQYFDELQRGQNSGGVAHTLGQDEPFRNLVFDLLYDGKFRNWSMIRLLKYFDEDVRAGLNRAREVTDIEEAQDIVEQYLTDARNKTREVRETGVNRKIEDFVRYLESLPVSTFRDTLLEGNLRALLNALKLVEKLVTEQLNIKK